MSTFGEEDDASLPPERAFVLQFRRAAGDRPEAFVGRIEHVKSGESSRFASVEEAVAFISRVLRGGAREDPSTERS